MKKALKRIEEALNQLETLKAANEQPNAVKNRTYSFDIFPTAKSDSLRQQKSDFLPQRPESATLELPNLNSNNSHPLSDRETNVEFSISENSPEPDDEVQFEQVIYEIQDLYHQGPILDGWLEYYPPAPEANESTLREVSFERVIEVEVVDGLTSADCVPGASYRLCGLDASGKQWSYPCPLDQLPSVTIAIARYQKLQQLLQQKQELDRRMKYKV